MCRYKFIHIHRHGHNLRLFSKLLAV